MGRAVVRNRGLLILAACAAGAALGSLLQPGHDAEVALELREVLRVGGGLPVLVLQERGGARRLPIPISRAEAALIERSLARGAPGLTESSLRALGGRVLRASIDELGPAASFRAHLTIGSGGREVLLEAAAGEALALALEAGAPIFADKDLLDAAAVSPKDLRVTAHKVRQEGAPAAVHGI